MQPTLRDLAAPRTALGTLGLTKAFGGRVVVDDVSLQIVRGRIHGLLGPNGAGKSTILRMLLGLVGADSGTITHDGHPLSSHEPRGRRGIAGFVDAPSFYPYLTASRNLELLSAWDGRGSHARVEERLALVGLTDRAQRKVRGFSTGMRQRLGLAAAMISDPGLLIIDEPTAGLDSAGVRDIHSLILAMADSDRTVLLSSHDLVEVERLCSDVTVLREGRIVYTGTIAALRDRAGGRAWSLDTSDNDTALLVATAHPHVTVSAAGRLLQVSAGQPHFDRFSLDLSARGVAIRELTRDELSFETLYFQLTADTLAQTETAPSWP